MRSFLLLFILFSIPAEVREDLCLVSNETVALSDRIANYVMTVDLLEEKHLIRGRSEITWINRSPEQVDHVRLYMYLNAFQNSRSSYLRGGEGLGSELIADRPDEDWGRIKVLQAEQAKQSLDQKYVQPTDGNLDDESVLEITLAKPIAPGDTLSLDLTFESKLPRIMARSGFAEHGFMHWVHWYPKLGVFEKNSAGKWDWNCSQFLPRMEFYGDHGNYDVTINGPANWTFGGSGCLTTTELEAGRSNYQFYAHDVIDFAFVASPHLAVKKRQWKDVQIRYLYPPSHEGHADRLIDAAVFALEYLSTTLGPYPYQTLTVLDPPVYGLRSGFMEYPTYITGGSFYAWPKQIRTIESLVIHEFGHQYFMQMLANNEKEEPWLDEGFVTYYEDRVMEAMLGETASLFDVFGYHVSNSQFTRNEYVSIAEGYTDPIATKSWEFKGPYKGIVYSKAATVLKTIEAYLGTSVFDEMMRTYFERHQFDHPKAADFLTLLRETFEKAPSLFGVQIDDFIDETIYGVGTCDYAVEGIELVGTDREKEQRISLSGEGDLKLPVEVEITFEDGNKKQFTWDGQSSSKVYDFPASPLITAVEIDPGRKNLLDLDLNNNSLMVDGRSLGRLKYGTKVAFWFQQIFNTLAVLL